jgi:TRAP-type C4-dicarboxylate transport system permease small subunit
MPEIDPQKSPWSPDGMPDRDGMFASLQTCLTGSSDRIAQIERSVMGLLIGLLFFVVLTNLVSRSLGWALYWADELAVYLMVWAALVGASISVKLRNGVSVRLLHGYLPNAGVRALDLTADCLVLFCALSLLFFSWLWYDPLLLVRSGFDLSAFKHSSFNFIYHEPAVTLAIQKYWLWLIMPITALTMSLHAGSNLAESISGKTQASLQLEDET